MALQKLSGVPLIFPGAWGLDGSVAIPSLTNSGTMDAAKEAIIYYGHWVWEDGEAHTIDTSGSSKLLISVSSSGLVFASASTTLKVGFATLDAANGPPARATNSADVITFLVNWQGLGNGGGIAAGINSLTPTTGSELISHGELIALCVQMTARGGTDSVSLVGPSSNASQAHFPNAVGYTGGSYSNINQRPNVMAIASDGTRGWFFGSIPTGSVTGIATETLSTSSTPDEIGNVFRLSTPARCIGYALAVDPDAAFDVVLYGTPFGTATVLATKSHDDDNMATASIGLVYGVWDTPVDLDADTDYAIVLKPTTTTSVGVPVITPGDAAFFDVMPLGDTCHYVARTDAAAAFTATTTKRAQIAPAVWGFSDGVSASPIANLKQFGRGAPY